MPLLLDTRHVMLALGCGPRLARRVCRERGVRLGARRLFIASDVLDRLAGGGVGGRLPSIESGQHTTGSTAGPSIDATLFVALVRVLRKERR
ncbi:hypothetical protein [Anaeromyxobacter diazotrophicus]|uniref:Uncharacterized protein n=1 Tax=Anaeromyxobacter diazotrophicus TaxID=2590199 RepID=A0A7I9VKJ0_9BACT|nr:hypothetical protein [Anaeromyxobacter diazotrophicus]GEJ56922.1 hypothetical protein AMYX_16630 [Anaeromyxobacter diazotrophicus]